jgi:hypothetical protein
MKRTKKKPAKKTTERNHRFKSANGEAAHNTARLFLDRCTTAISTEKSVLLTLRDYFAKNRPQLVRFIIEHSACKDPAELACRALIVTGWLDLKTRGFAKLKSK